MTRARARARARGKGRAGPRLGVRVGPPPVVPSTYEVLTDPQETPSVMLVELVFSAS